MLRSFLIYLSKAAWAQKFGQQMGISLANSFPVCGGDEDRRCYYCDPRIKCKGNQCNSRSSGGKYQQT